MDGSLGGPAGRGGGGGVLSSQENFMKMDLHLVLTKYMSDG